MAIDIIARGMIEDSNGNISQLSEKVSNHTDNGDIHVTVSDKENWNNHPNDVMASGNPVQIDGLQEGVPFSEIVVSGKNLIPSDYMTKSGTYNGVTVTVKNDGRVDLSGTATSEGYILTILVNYPLIGGKKYTFNCNKQYDVNTFNLGLIIRDKNGNWKAGLDSFPKTITADDGDYISSWKLWTYNGVEYSAENIEIQLELGSTPTEYEPPITGRELTVNVCGKNLLKYPYVQTTRTSYGITFTDNGDGSITASGTHDGGANISYFGFSPWWATPNGGRLFLPKGNTVTLRVMGLPNTYQCQLVVKKDNTSTDTITVVYGIGKSAANYTAEQDCYIACGIIGLPSSVGQAVNFTAYPQLELGDTATEYESYHGNTTTIIPTSNPYVIPNDIRQVDGYNVITVSEGELYVTGVRKNAAIKRIWDDMGMDLLFDGLALVASPAEIDLGNYSKYLINCYYDPNAVSKGHCISIVVEYDRLKNIVDNAGVLIHSIYTSYVLELHFSGIMDNANYYVKQNDNESAAYYTRIYGIK